MMKSYAVITVILGLIAASSGKDLPSYFPRCSIDDKNLNDCLLKATETMRPYIKKGIPELGIPSFDPLIIPKISLEQGTPNLHYKVTIKDMEIRGMDNYKFNVFKYDPKTVTFHGTGIFESMSFKGNYEIDGQFLLVPIQGNGVVTSTIVNASGTVDAIGKLETRNGQEYYVIDKVIAKIDTNDGVMNFDGLFNGNKELSTATNRVLNENSKEILKEISPAIEKLASELLIRMMKGIAHDVPYKKLLPPSN